jgi:hypothetical protein
VSVTPYSGGARLAVDRRAVDYGAVGYGEAVRATWRIQNAGDQRLDLRTPTVKTLEGC